MNSAASRIPNFAGVALVDILANGVAVLVIVIVLSIAARAEQEERYSEKVQEIGVVMTREFSTSLVLNRMAASSPALLHDYENSRIDQVWHPVVMPVLEFHRNAVRDPYTGTVWSRSELLQSPNTLDEFLVDLLPSSRESIRGDIYDVGTYYLLMSILRDHGIRIWHWHFMGGQGAGSDAGSLGDCPPGVSFQDCQGRLGSSTEELPGLPDLGGLLDLEDEQSDDEFGEGSWPPTSMEDCPPGMDCGSGLEGSDIPEGSALGMGAPNDPSTFGSFPDARQRGVPGMGSPSGGPSGALGAGSQSGALEGDGEPNQDSIQLRLADPSILGDNSSLAPSITDMLELIGALMLYLDDLQVSLDARQPPTELLADFLIAIAENTERLTDLTPDQLAVVQDLYDSMSLSNQIDDGFAPPKSVSLEVTTVEELDQAILQFLPNRILFDVEAIVDPRNPPEGFDYVVPKLSLNRFPDIWKGLQVTLHQGSVVLLPPVEEAAPIPQWRAVAHITPNLDDIVVGFVYSTIDDDGLLSVLAESNRVRIDGQSIAVRADVAFFGVKTWLVILYCVLAALVIVLVLFWRPGMRRTE